MNWSLKMLSFNAILLIFCHNYLSYFDILYLFCYYPYPIVLCFNNPNPCHAPSPFCLSSLTQTVTIRQNRNVSLAIEKSWTYIQQTAFSPFPPCPLNYCFIGSVVLALNQGLQTWLCAALYVVSYFLAARGHDCLAHFRLRSQSATHVDADLL